MDHARLAQPVDPRGRHAVGVALLALAAVCVAVPSRSLLWWTAVPLAIGAGALLEPAEAGPRWVRALLWGLAAWVAYASLTPALNRLDVSLGLVAVSTLWLAWRVASVRRLQGAGIALAALAVVALASVAWRAHVGLSGSLSRMEVWQAEDQGLVSPLLWTELAVGLGVMALPLLVGEARSLPRPRQRLVARLMALPLVLGLGVVAGAFGALCVGLGLLWACARGGWLRRPAWIGLGVIAIGCCAYAVHELPDRANSARNHAVTAAQALVDVRAYAWSSSLQPALADPVRWLSAPAGLARGWPVERPISTVSVAGVERTRSVLSDAVLLSVELGWAGPAFALIGVVALMRTRGDRSAAGLAGALAGGGAYALLVGHLASPLNAGVLLAIALRLLHGRSNSVPAASSQARRYGGPALGIALAVLICTLAPAVPESVEGTQAHSARAAATAEPSPRAYAEAAQAYLVRWEALHAPEWGHPTGRIRGTAEDYRGLCLDYAGFLEEQGDPLAARAYRALADQLWSAAWR